MNEEEKKTVNFQTSASTLLKTSNIKEEIQKHIDALLDKVDKYTRNGSGWVVDSVNGISVMMTKYSPMGGGSYIQLPSEIRQKTSLLNIQNRDDKCLLWCLLARLNPASDKRERVSKYQSYENELNMAGITYPVSLSQIPKVERQNNLAINVYTWEKEEGFYPLYTTDSMEDDPILLLLIANESTQHYVLIKSISGLLSNRTKNKSQVHYCLRCLHGFMDKTKLAPHYEDCKKFKVQRIEMPTETHIEFKAFRKMIKLPVYIILDFEALVEELPKDKDPKTASWTQKVAHHRPIAYALKVSSQFDEWDMDVEYYQGADAAKHLVLRLNELYEKLKPIIFANVPMKNISPERRGELNSQKDCYLCGKKFRNGEEKHLDHCHYTGDVLGYTHGPCNQERRTEKHLPIITHNFKGYDCHMLINDLCNSLEDLNEVYLIPKSMEKYTSVSTEKFKFIDSFQHLPQSMEKLASNLKKDGNHNLKPLKDYVDASWGGDTNKFELLTRKGVYPYSYMSNESRMNEGLPSKDKFFNDLNGEKCSVKDYQHVNDMWQEFGMQNLGDLTKIYCISDVLLLTSIFNKYRDDSLANFSLDPLHYYTAPGEIFVLKLYTMIITNINKNDNDIINDNNNDNVNYNYNVNANANDNANDNDSDSDNDRKHFRV